MIINHTSTIITTIPPMWLSSLATSLSQPLHAVTAAVPQARRDEERMRKEEEARKVLPVQRVVGEGLVNQPYLGITTRLNGY